MKKLLLSVLLLIGGITGIFSQIPVFRLPFNGNGVDASGNGFAGHCTPDSLFSSTYRIEGAFSWAGDDNHNWESKGPYTFGDRAFSFSAWVRLYSFYGGYHCLLANKESDGSYGFDIQWDETNQRFYGRTSKSGGTNDFYTASSILTYNTPYFLVGVVRSTGSITLFLDNVKLTLSDSVILTDWFLGPDTLAVGGYTGAVQSREWYSGYIDNFQFYDYCLSTAQADSLYDNRTSSTFQLGEAGGGPPPSYDPPQLRVVREGIDRAPERDGITVYFTRDIVPSADNFTGKVLFVDAIDGDDVHTGLSEEDAVKTLARAQVLLDNTFDFLVLSDTTHYGTLNIASIVRSYGDPLTITTWHKYGPQERHAKAKGLTSVTSFTDEAGDFWTKELAGAPIRHSVIYPDYVYMTSHLNGIYINGTYHKVSKFPNPRAYLSFEAGNGTNYFTDNQGVGINDYWNDGYIVCQIPEWVNTKLRVTDYTSSGVYSFTEKNEEELMDVFGSGMAGVKYFMENHHNAADVSGEWTWDYDDYEIEVYYPGSLNSQSVYIPLVDSVFSVYNSSYIKIENIDFYGGNKEQIKIEGSTGVEVDDCGFIRSPFAGVGIFGSDTISVTNSTFLYPSDNGIASMFNDHVTFTDNYIRGAGTDATFGGDRRGFHLIGIFSFDEYGDIVIERNEIDSTGYNAISVTCDYPWAGQADVDILIKNNYIHHAINVLADGGAIYTSGYGNQGTPTKIIRGNIITDTWANNDYNQTGLDHVWGIYHDSWGHYWLVDSNYVNNISTAILCQPANGGNGNFVYRRNTFSNIQEDDATYDYGFLYAEEGGNIDTVTFTRNDIIVYYPNPAAAGDLAWPMYLDNTSFGEYENYVDSSRYFDPYRLSADSTWGILNRSTWSIVPTSIADMQLTTGWEDHSTLNSSSWTYGDVDELIDKDEFIWFFINFSSAAYLFPLGANQFYDLSGGVATGNYSVPAYSAKVLFYKSGNYTGATIHK